MSPSIIDLSFNEAAALCRKAARGAGYSWGEADDVTAAMIALAKTTSFPSSFLRAALKADRKSMGWKEKYSSETFVLCPTDEKIHPLALGISFLDRRHFYENLTRESGFHLVIKKLAWPVLFLAFLRFCPGFFIQMDEQESAISARGKLRVTGDWQDPVGTLTIIHSPEPTDVSTKEVAWRTRLVVDAANYEQLEQLARETYAPADPTRRQDAGE